MDLDNEMAKLENARDALHESIDELNREMTDVKKQMREYKELADRLLEESELIKAKYIECTEKWYQLRTRYLEAKAKTVTVDRGEMPKVRDYL